MFRAALLVAVFAGGFGLAASAALAEDIVPGLWRIISRTETGGVIGPPHESSRCITAEEAQDVAATFAPPAGAANSSCAPVEHTLSGQKLTWRMTCRGQTDMEQTGEFTFDSPRHYTATMQTRAAVSGKTMIDSQDIIEGQWVSECR
ncbi:MAG: DUF3617 family protein [Xanthobacteraceae bacterium]|nr:DUF3617 family protein [Xanthobacteraceae bacterium]